jgi:hypothetical protein
MELTLESALSAEAALGHVSYLLLVASMISRRMAVLRTLVIASALVAIAYSVLILSDPVGVFWESCLVAVNIVQLTRLWREDRAARFSDEDRLLTDGRLPPLAPGIARRFLDTGDWVDLAPGETLTREGVRPEALYFLASASADVLVGGRRIATLAPGRFVGEMALLEEAGTASATVIVSAAGRAWRLPYAKLARMESAQPEAWGAMNAAIARDMRAKIVARNASA